MRLTIYISKHDLLCDYLLTIQCLISRELVKECARSKSSELPRECNKKETHKNIIAYQGRTQGGVFDPPLEDLGGIQPPLTTNHTEITYPKPLKRSNKTERE